MGVGFEMYTYICLCNARASPCLKKQHSKEDCLTLWRRNLNKIEIEKEIFIALMRNLYAFYFLRLYYFNVTHYIQSKHLS